jgi:hypothetical protein
MMTASPKVITAPQTAAGGLEPGWFYLPKLGPFARPNPIPVATSRLVAQFRAEFDGSVDRPRLLDLSVFGDIADHGETAPQ